MPNENSLWKKLQKNMKPYWRARRIENSVLSGTPDVYFTLLSPPTMGWMELKHVPSWPKKETTPLKIKHFTPEQKLFLYIHGSAGANVWVFLQIEKDHLLIWWDAALKIGELTKGDLISNSYYWKNHLSYKELAKALGKLF